MKVIAFTGMPYSGKSEAVQIAKELGIPIIRMGDLVWEKVENKGLALSSENVGIIAHEMRMEKGKDIWAKKTVERIHKMNISQCVVIDGVRNIEEIKVFKEVFDLHFFLISIHASDEIRHHRAMERGRIDDSANIQDIKNRDKREIQWGIQEVMKKADKRFYNEGSLAAFHRQIEEFFMSL